MNTCFLFEATAEVWLRIFRLACVTCLAFLLVVSNPLGAQEASVDVLTYHSKPPYIIDFDGQRGSYFDFIRLLNRIQQDYVFELKYIPRKRLDRLLQDEAVEGFVIGVNPKWFDDVGETKYLWTTTLYSDRDEFVSLADSPFEYNGAASLAGKVVAVSRGFVYRDLDELVSTGLVQRVDTANEEAVLDLVVKGRVDAGIVSLASLPVFVESNGYEGKLYLSGKPHDVFHRRILLPRNNQHLYPLLEHAVCLSNKAECAELDENVH